MTRGARLSVVMPVRDAAPFLEAAVGSVFAQTWPDIELIAVDDGSTDGSHALLERLAAGWTGPGRRMILRRQETRGPSAARNAGVEAASGALIAFFDADDVFHPTLAARLIEALEAEPELDLVFALYRYVGPDGERLGTQPAPARARPAPKDLLKDNLVHAPLFRARAWEVAGPLDPGLQAHEDLDFFARLLLRRPGAIGVVDAVLSDYRRRPGQITQDWRRMRRNWARAFAKLRREGVRLSKGERREVRARLSLYWGTLAYHAGEHEAARRLVAAAWRADPRGLAGDPHAWIRAAACLTTLLPHGLHDAVRRRVNARLAA
jgi:glycosyltransferase involved in cell wall biosynthesis